MGVAFWKPSETNVQGGSVKCYSEVKKEDN